MTTASNSSSTDRDARPDLRDVTVVVPVRNGETLLPGCLQSLHQAGAEHIVVVDGLSTDRSRMIAAEHGATVLSDEGRGLPVARALGARWASTRWVVLVDVDVVFPADALQQLLDEFVDGKYTALQAGLHSVGGPGYWGRALAHHHQTGRSRYWFGLVATVFERDELLRIGFDEQFSSGEDIEIRWRLRDGNRRIGVSRQVSVQHRFAGDDFGFAKRQFLMDGAGLGRMVRKHRERGIPLLFLPLAAAMRGTLLSVVRREPQWLPYYALFLWFNYRGVIRVCWR